MAMIVILSLGTNPSATAVSTALATIEVDDKAAPNALKAINDGLQIRNAGAGFSLAQTVAVMFQTSPPAS